MPEPGNPQALNRYSYALNNALRYTDPTGHSPQCAFVAGAGLFGPIAALVCEIGYAAISYWPQIQALTADVAQFAASGQGQLALQHAQQVDAAVKQAAANTGNNGSTADPGGLDPKKLDPEKARAIVKGGEILRRWGPHDGPGPLPEKIASTFRSASYSEVKLTEDITLYRSYGGKAGEIGAFWTRTQPRGPLQAQLDAAILPEWGNSMTQVTRIRVPAGTTIYEGYAAEQLGLLIKLLGGGNQVYIPYVDPSWLIK